MFRASQMGAEKLSTQPSRGGCGAVGYVTTSRRGRRGLRGQPPHNMIRRPFFALAATSRKLNRQDDREHFTPIPMRSVLPVQPVAIHNLLAVQYHRADLYLIEDFLDGILFLTNFLWLIKQKLVEVSSILGQVVPGRCQQPLASYE